ncbi:MAG: hypothetical protein K0R54_717 [Clostridiaceae bacterium]|nr:hypothetical protein [Clostridiaceae bacterium]
MKSNIDLTESRHFQKDTRDSKIASLNKISSDFLVNRIKLIQLNKTFPWDFKRKKLSEEANIELFLTGSKEDRLYKKNCIDYDIGTQCECCGFDFRKKLWLNDSSRLCPKCMNYLENSMRKSNSIFNI